MQHGERYKGLAPPRKTTKQRTPTIKPCTQTTVDRHNSSTKHRAPLAKQPTSQFAPAIISTMHTTSTANHGLYRTNPAGSSLESAQPTQLSSCRRRAQPHNNTNTTPKSGDTRGTPRHPSPGAVTGYNHSMETRMETRMRARSLKSHEPGSCDDTLVCDKNRTVHKDQVSGES